jgi:hypothetical protein
MPLARRVLSSSLEAGLRERFPIDARRGVHDRSRKLARASGREDPIHDETVAQRGLGTAVQLNNKTAGVTGRQRRRFLFLPSTHAIVDKLLFCESI